MSTTSRLGTAAGVALLAAGSLVVAPVVPPPRISSIGVGLTASPIDPYIDLVTNTFTNLGAIGARWRDDPLPALQQLGVNSFDHLQATVGAFVDAGQSFIAGLTNLPDQLQTLFDAVTTSDFEAAIAMLIIIVISSNPLLGLVDRLLEIPYGIVGNAVSTGLAVLHAVQVPIGAGLLTSAQATIAQLELIGQDLLDGLRDGDLSAVLVKLVEAPALILDASLNSDTPGLPGLLTAAPDLSQTGFLDGVVNFLPRAIAQALGADVLDEPAGPAELPDITP